MGERLTEKEVLQALKYCKGYIGGDSCTGCPNAVPGTEDGEGFCQCRFNIYDESIRVLEALIGEK